MYAQKQGNSCSCTRIRAATLELANNADYTDWSTTEINLSKFRTSDSTGAACRYKKHEAATSKPGLNLPW